ncbi:MAG: phage tail tape measure protein [Patescibacteria group bacterium]|nr:phage tail tape measure protein [Patescibacteria group bacterium]
MNVGKIVVDLVANTEQFQKSLAASQSRLASFGAKAQSIGKGMSMYVTLPLLAAAAGSVALATKFQSSMELIRTQAGASQAEVDKMSKAVLSLGGQVKQGPNELAAGLYHLESLGLRGSQALAALKTSAQAAATGGANLEDVSTALGAALVTGIKGTQNLSRAMGLLNAITGAGNMRMQDLVGALSTGILSSAKSAGLSLQSVGAALATLTDNGMPAQAAATRLRMSLSLLGAPTKAAAKEFKTIGLSTLQLGQDMRSNNGLVKALKDLKSHLDASGLSATQQSEVIARAFGGGRSSGAILTMLGEIDRVNAKYVAIGANANDFGIAVQQTTKTASYQFGQLVSTIETTAIQLGSMLMPAALHAAQKLGDLMEALSHAFAWFQKLNPATKKFIEAIALIALGAGPAVLAVGLLGKAAVFMLTPFAKMVGFASRVYEAFMLWAGGAATFGEALDLVLGPVGIVIAIIAVLAAAAYLIVKNWGPISAFFKKLWGDVSDWFTKTITSIGDWIHKEWTALITWIEQAWNDVATFFSNLWTSIKTATEQIWGKIADFFKRWWPLLLAIFLPGIGIVIDLVAKNWTTIKATSERIWNDISAFFAKWWDDIKAAWATSTKAVSSVLSTAWTDIKSTADQWWGDISTAIQKPISEAGTSLRKMWNDLKAFAGDVWNAIVGVITPPINTIESIIEVVVSKINDAVSSVQGAISTVSGIWNSVKGIVGNVGSAISSAANAANTALGGANASGSTIAKATAKATPKAAAKAVLKVPHYATGGLVTRPTLAMIGEAGPEAVLPLSKYPIQSSPVTPLPAGGGQAPIVINVTGNTFLSRHDMQSFVEDNIMPAMVSVLRRRGVAVT